MTKPNGFVLNGAVTLAWYFMDEADAYADIVLESLAETEAVVPAHWALETANALLTSERRGLSTEDQATTWVRLLRGFPIRIDEETAARVSDDTLSIARIHSLAPCDASYLELAIRRGLPLATLDAKVKAAAQAVGVPIYQATP